MPVRARWLAALLLAGAALVRAQTPEPASAAACTACHGGGSTARLPGTPAIAGQPKTFIENQLVLIREGLREVPVMAAAVKGLSDEDIGALARHYAAMPPPVAAANAAQPARQRAGAELSRQLLCGTCHLPGYVGQNQVPRLAAQDEAYLRHSMTQFRDNPGPGRDTIMASTLRGLSDAQLADLAHYLATTP
jgi:cytochrome c553